MATVNNLLTRIHDAEGTLTTVSIGGGQGATANTDIYLQGAQSLGRRQTNTTDAGGFTLVDAADNNCSAADVHVGFWFWVTHYGILDAVNLILSSGTALTNYDQHTFDYANEYPGLGGWVRAWIDVSRAPDVTGGTGLNEAALRQYGLSVSFTAAPGGNAQNVILDSADFTSGGAALSLTGTAGVWSDFTAADESGTNQYGVFRSAGGVYNCNARVQLGSASSLVFSDSNFTIVFPQQSLVADTFMGISVDLQNASTSVDWESATITSAGTKKGDLRVSGTSGSFSLSASTLANLRIIDLTAAATISGTLFSGCGQITLGGATLSSCNIVNSTAAIALACGSSVSTISGIDFVSSGTGHALEITGGTSHTLDAITFSGYAASNGSTGNEAVFVNIASGNVTIYADSTFSYRTAGATVTIVAGSVTTSLTVLDESGSPISGANTLVAAADGTGALPFQDSVTITNSGTTATVSHTAHNLETNDKILIKGASHYQNNGVFSVTVTGANSYTYAMASAPGSNPTGSIVATWVALYGSTDANGKISMSRVFSQDQPVAGWARKSSAAPYYKTGQVAGTIDSTTGAALSALLIADGE